MDTNTGNTWKRPVFAARIALAASTSLTLAFIFSSSAQTGTESSGLSAEVTRIINGILENISPGLTLTEYTVRKLAHFSEYGVLGFQGALALRTFTRKTFAYMSWPLLFGILAAVSDEIMQTFVPGRSGTVTDVAIDFAGYVSGMAAGIALTSIIAAARRKSKKI